MNAASTTERIPGRRASPAPSMTATSRTSRPGKVNVSGVLNSAPLIAASIFLDALNVFFFFLRIFARQN